MKKCILFCFCLFAVPFVYAQALKPVAETVAKHHSVHTHFSEYSFFGESSITTGDEKYKDIVSQYTLAQLDLGQLTKLRKNKPQTVEFAIPYGQQTIILELYRVQIATDDFRVNTNRGMMKHEAGVFYRGIIKGDNNSLVAFSFFEDEIIGIASGQTFGNINVGRLREPGNLNDYIIYSDRYLMTVREFSCATSESPILEPIDGGNAYSQKSTRTSRCVRIYYEISNFIYGQFGQDLTQIANWTTAVHNNMAAIYANDGITIALSEIFVWTTPQPFAGLEGFTAYRRAFNGDVAVGVGFGGMAWQGLLCAANNAGTGTSAGPYCVTYGDTAVQPVPVFSESVSVNAHETGHVMGSPHTHLCVWNGNNTQIDDCGYSFEPGPCYDSQNPILPTNGTIMSYCPIFDFSQGFGPQPAQLIRNRVEGAPCLGTDCINSCVSTIDSITVEVYSYAGLLTIYDSNPQADAWELRTSTNDPWMPISSPTYVIPLWPNNQFDIQVREVCAGNFTANFITGLYVVTPVSFCGQHVYDGGGLAYPYTRFYAAYTYFPGAPGTHVTLTFNQFDVNPVDTVRIYNGPDTNATYVSFTGATLPPEISSTHPSGALTVALIPSTGYNGSPGWDISVNCVANPTTAAFSVSDTQICQGQQVTFTDESSNNTTSWNWTFPGGSPDTSTAQNPTVVYATAGTYGVTLTATNAGGTDSETQNAYIVVNAPPMAPVVTNTGGVFQSGYATGNQWYNSAGAISGATGQTYTPTANDYYYVTHTDADGCVSTASNSVVWSASLEEWLLGGLKIYPNPIGNRFNISWSESEMQVTDIRLYDIAGRLVYVSKMPVTNPMTIHAEHLSVGSYVLQLVTPKGNICKPLVK